LASSAGGYTTFLDQMTTVDSSFGNLTKARTTNLLGALNSRLNRGEGNGGLTFDPYSPISINYGIKTYDDRFISISASNLSELVGLNTQYSDDFQYLTPLIEGGACPNNGNGEEVLDAFLGGGSISSSIWITIANSETLSAIKTRIYNLDELKECSFVFYDATTGVPTESQWRTHKFSILDWEEDESSNLKIKLGNVLKKSWAWDEDGNGYSSYWRYVWVDPSENDNYDDFLTTNVSYSIIIDETLPVIQESDLYFEEDQDFAYKDIRNDNILNFKYLIQSWWTAPESEDGAGQTMGDEWGTNNEVIELPVLTMSFPADSEYIFEAKSLLSKIYVELSQELKYGLGLGIRAWSFSGDAGHVISTDSPLTANIGHSLFSHCYIPGRRYPTNNGINGTNFEPLSGGTCWNTMQVKVPNLSNASNWNQNFSLSADKTTNIVLEFSIKTNFRWYWRDPYNLGEAELGLNSIAYLKDFALYSSNQGESFINADNIKFYNNENDLEKVFDNGNLITGLATSDGSASIDSDRVVEYLLGQRRIPGLQTTSLISESLLVNNNLRVLNHFEAASKSFVIPDQYNNNMLLQHGSLEGPEHGVYIRNVIKSNSNSHLIEFPDYWSWLINPDSITVIITPMGRWQELWYEVTEKGIIVRNNKDEFIECSIQINAERIDVNKLQLRIEK